MKTSTTQRKTTLILENADVLQILDALNDRAQAWENTEASLLGKFESEDIFIPEECDEPSEASEIAQHFRDIISTIEVQLNNHN
ncbi:MAG: hypothetical protein H0X72_17480 [Acidobacteria bacterium]|jgi:hypothetical protein|nr:hypothetical protein [Acidobacteriota bacterium]